MAQGSDDTSTNLSVFMWIIGLIAAFIIISYLFEYYVIAWRYLRIAEIAFLAFITPDFIEAYIGSDFEGGYRFLLSTNPELINAKIVGTIDAMYVKFLYWIPGMYLMYRGFKLFIDSSDITTIYTMENLLIFMADTFPNVKPFMGIHPEKTGIDYYPDDESTAEYSMGMTERQFATTVPPLGLQAEAERDSRLMKPIWVEGSNKIDEDLARKSFDSQLGGLYKGYNKLTHDERSLNDLFVSRILIKRKEVMPVLQNYLKQAYLQVVAERTGKTPPPFVLESDAPSHKSLRDRLKAKVAQELDMLGSWKPTEMACRDIAANREFKRALQQLIADRITSSHAYVSTGLMTLLEAAREGGTLPPSQLRWLKGRNRPLWYSINCPGKKTSYLESSGVFAHWLLEQKAGFAIPHAETTEAIEALKVALDIDGNKSSSNDPVDEWG